jgi:hypothetical protein
MGKCRRGDAAIFFPSVEVIGADHGGARGRPAVMACVLCSAVGGGRRWLARPSGPKGQMGQLAARPKVEGQIVSE